MFNVHFWTSSYMKKYEIKQPKQKAETVNIKRKSLFTLFVVV